MSKPICIAIAVIALNTSSYAQQKKAEKIPTVIKPLSMPVTSKGSSLTEGKDLVITIDRVEDNSLLDLNKFTVYYTAKNTGTEDINLGAKQIQIQATFYNAGGDYICAGGASVLNTAGRVTFPSGVTIQGSIDVISDHLLTNTAYQLRLEIDASKHITEANENNNAAQTNITAHAIKNADYFVSSAKITIQTGNDNKEANNSQVYFYLGPANYNESSFFSLGNWSKGTGYAPEMKINSSTDIVLSNAYAMGNPYNSLCFYKQKGVALTIIYNNKGWATDAWKINGITITLYFKDKNGNPYPNPSFASKSIYFPNISNLLGFRMGDNTTSNENQLRMLTIGTDQNFVPLPPVFEKVTNNRFTALVLTNSSTYNTQVNYCN
jgi:hypothetical protein